MERMRGFYNEMNKDKKCVWTHSISDNFDKINYEQLDTELVPNNIYIIHQHRHGITMQHIIGRFISSDVLNGKTHYIFEPYWSRIVRFDDSESYSQWNDSKEETYVKTHMEKFLKSGNIYATNKLTGKTQYNPYLVVITKADMIEHDYYDIYDASKHDTFGLFRTHLPTTSPEEICKLLPQHRIELARALEGIGSKHPGSDDPLLHSVMSFLKTGGTRKRTLRRTDVVSEVKRRISTHIPKEDVGFLRNMKFGGRTRSRHHRRRRS